MRAIDVLNKCQQHRSLQSCLFDFNLNAELVKYKVENFVYLITWTLLNLILHQILQIIQVCRNVRECTCVRVFSILSIFLFRQGFTWAFTQCFYENGSRCFHVSRFWSCVLRITPRTPHQWWNACSIFSNWVSKIQLLHFISYQLFCSIIFLDYHYLLCYDISTIYLSWFCIQLQYKVILHFFRVVKRNRTYKIQNNDIKTRVCYKTQIRETTNDGRN